MTNLVKLNINGQDYEVAVKPYDTLNYVLREKLDVTGTKRGCDYGGCGACTVLLDGKAIYSCMTFASGLEGKKIQTVEGLLREGKPNPLQEAFMRNYAIQCGYCTPGMLMSATGLLAKNSKPSEGEIRHALAGNLCRCTGYVKIVEAIIQSMGKK